MKRYRLFIILAAIFLGASGTIYFTHYLIFRDPHHIFIYLVGDLGFLPLEAFIVVVVVERLLTRREKHTLMQKLNMVVGAFFSEMGNRLLGDLLKHIKNSDELRQHLAITPGWTHKEFKKAAAFAQKANFGVDCCDLDLDGLKAFLVKERMFMLTLLENPNLLEHERFTDLLWAASHLAEELEVRSSLEKLPESDTEHIAGDIQRLYGRLVAEWVAYVEHLKLNYPFLFSLVLRTHPFQEHPSPVVK
ncbi:MAG: hypothetical protein V1691_01705 [Chloroflexota bacterium]